MGPEVQTRKIRPYVDINVLWGKNLLQQWSTKINTSAILSTKINTSAILRTTNKKIRGDILVSSGESIERSDLEQS